ncbi:MAG: type VI secretion system baseplate subunit TssE [Planctomycetota bacterium]
MPQVSLWRTLLTGSTSREAADVADELRDDLEMLLSTRVAVSTASTQATLGSSLTAFGLVDPNSLPGGRQRLRARLRTEIELTVRRFEPRLREVRVFEVANGDSGSLCFEVRGRLAQTVAPVCYLTRISRDGQLALDGPLATPAD